MTYFLGFDWLRDIAQLTRIKSAVGFNTMTHYESGVG